jgi:hypothetical protein
VLYKVTPMLMPVEASKPVDAPKEPRKRRKSAVFDGDGNEVLITMMCLKCRTMKPLAMFGLRKMADGAIRNQPWCRTCRSGAGSKKAPQAVATAPESPAAPTVEAMAGPTRAEPPTALEELLADPA